VNGPVYPTFITPGSAAKIKEPNPPTLTTTTVMIINIALGKYLLFFLLTEFNFSVKAPKKRN
jgi:hypothetical protein